MPIGILPRLLSDVAVQVIVAAVKAAAVMTFLKGNDGFRREGK